MGQARRMQMLLIDISNHLKSSPVIPLHIGGCKSAVAAMMAA